MNRLFFISPTLDADEEVSEIAGVAIGMAVDRIGAVGDQASEGRLLGCMEQVSVGSLV